MPRHAETPQKWSSYVQTMKSVDGWKCQQVYTLNTQVCAYTPICGEIFVYK